MVDYLLLSVEPHVHECCMDYTSFPKGVLYRPQPNYNAKPRYDHALVGWNEVTTPARIPYIANLHNLKPNYKIQFPQQAKLFTEPGLQVIVRAILQYH